MAKKIMTQELGTLIRDLQDVQAAAVDVTDSVARSKVGDMEIDTARAAAIALTSAARDMSEAATQLLAWCRVQEMMDRLAAIPSDDDAGVGVR